MSHRGVGMAFIALQLPMLYLMTPFIRPRRLARFALTYALPAIPALTAFDGAMSMLRLYLPDQLRELVASVEGAETFDWDIGTTRMPFAPVHVTHLLGVPAQPMQR